MIMKDSYTHSFMPLVFFSEGGKWGVKDLEGDVVFPPIFDSFNTSSDDLNYTHFVYEGKSGFFVLCPGDYNLVFDAQRKYIWGNRALSQHIHKNMCFLIVCEWEFANGLDSAETDEIWDKANGLEIAMFAFRAKLKRSKCTIKTSDGDFYDIMTKFKSRCKNLIVPPGNMVGANLFVKVYEYLVSVYTAAGYEKIPIFPPCSYDSGMTRAFDNMLILPRLFFGRNDFSMFLTRFFQIEGVVAVTDIKQAFIDYIKDSQDCKESD